MSNIGRMIYGFCNGFFGRDDYLSKRIESEGYDWIVVRYDDDNNTLGFASFKNNEEKQQYIEDWSKEPNYD